MLAKSKKKWYYNMASGGPLANECNKFGNERLVKWR